MPKNQKNQRSFIVNSDKYGETNFNVNNSNNIFTDTRPSFPPNLTINDLTKNNIKSNNKNKPKTFPNAFIAYRMALIKECHNKNWKIPPMGEFSKITRNSWNTEPEYVKDYYVSLVKEAKSIYKQNNIQIVLDKHMSNNVNNIENKQESGLQDSLVTYDADSRAPPVEATSCIENSPNSVQNAVSASHYNVSFINSSLTDSSSNFEMNSDREYIKILEQIIESLLRANRFSL
jgi:hypothetical protein